MKQTIKGPQRQQQTPVMLGFHHSVAVLPLPFGRSAVVKFRCSIKIT